MRTADETSWIFDKAKVVIQQMRASYTAVRGEKSTQLYVTVPVEMRTPCISFPKKDKTMRRLVRIVYEYLSQMGFLDWHKKKQLPEIF